MFLLMSCLFLASYHLFLNEHITMHGLSYYYLQFKSIRMNTTYADRFLFGCTPL